MTTRRPVRVLLHSLNRRTRKIEQRWATPSEIAQLQVRFLRRLARLVKTHANKSWFEVHGRWFVNRDSGFQNEFKRLGRLAARAIEQVKP